MNEDVVIQLDVPATHQFLNVLGVCIVEMLTRLDEPRVDSDTLYQIQLAAHEICANVVDHGYAGEPGRIGITLRLANAPRRIIVELRDTGSHSFDPTRVVVPTVEELELHGRGLLLTRAAMDRVLYQTRDGRCWEARADEEWRSVAPSFSHGTCNFWRLVKLV